MTALAEWYQEQRLPFVLLDLDTENKARGSVAHFFRDRAQKVNIHTPAGLDALWIIWARRSGWCWPTWARAPDKSPRSGLRTSTKMRRRQVSCSPRSACDPDGFSLAGTRKCSAAARRHARASGEPADGRAGIGQGLARHARARVLPQAVF